MRRFNPSIRVCDVPRFPPSAVTRAAHAGTAVAEAGRFADGCTKLTRRRYMKEPPGSAAFNARASYKQLLFAFGSEVVRIIAASANELRYVFERFGESVKTWKERCVGDVHFVETP